MLRNEVLLVLAVSLGASAVYAVLSLLRKLLAPVPLSQSQATLNGSVVPNQAWLDLVYQLVGIGFGVVPALLALHLLTRDRIPRRASASTAPGPAPTSAAGRAARRGDRHPGPAALPGRVRAGDLRHGRAVRRCPTCGGRCRCWCCPPR